CDHGKTARSREEYDSIRRNVSSEVSGGRKPSSAFFGDLFPPETLKQLAWPVSTASVVDCAVYVEPSTITSPSFFLGVLFCSKILKRLSLLNVSPAVSVEP
ncbi:unnamed protein product, partial [Ectocarpus sp. 13 AM-2016]